MTEAVHDDERTTSERLRASLVTIRDSRRSVWILPAFLAVVVLLFTALGISGTSTPLLAERGPADPSVIVGTPRPIRSDEWMVRTPLVLGQIARDFPRYAEVGVGTHDMSVLADLPVADWPEVFRPHQVGYFLLPAANAFAFEWWSPVAILVLGVYALILVVVKDWRWAALAGLAMFASPYFHWWYFPSILAMVGWACAGLAAYLAALDATRSRSRWLLLALSAYSLCCFALVLYPPAQIPLVYVLVAFGLGVLVPRFLDRSIGWRRVLLDLAIVGGAVLVVVGAFVVTRRPALTAIAQTVYPGDRRVTGGAGSIAMLFSAWYGVQYATNDIGMRGVLFANESEASSFLYVGLMMIPGLPFVWRNLVDAGRRVWILTTALLAVIALLFAHYAIGLPGILTRLTLLDRVTEGRAIPALGLASVLLLVVVGTALRERITPVWRAIAAGAAMVVVGVFVVGSLGRDLRNAGAPVGRTTIALVVLAVAVVAALWFWRPIVSMTLMVVIGMVMVLGVHPLVHGLDHVTGTAFAKEVRAVHRATADDGSWLTDRWATSSVLTAAGVDNVSGVNQYPDHDAWSILDPTHRYEDVWNRYAITRWTFDATATAPEITLVQDDVVAIRVAPCDDSLRQLGVDHLVVDATVRVECMSAGGSITGPAGAELMIWNRRRAL